MNTINKFLKNKNTVTILGVIVCLIILYAGYNMRINAKTAMVEIFYANQTIQPKTKITDEMVARTSVPGAFIKGAYYKNYKDIVGKYSNYNTMIAEGSPFYTDLLVEEANLPDAIFYDVNEGERVVSYNVDTETTYGNSMMPGNKVDIYVKLIDEKGKIIYGEMFENIEILGVKDSQGKNVFENTEESRTPSYIYFSLEEAKYLLFSALNYVEEEYGNHKIEIVIVPNTATFVSEDPLAVEVTSDYLYNFVLNKLETIDNQKELYEELLNEMEQQKLEEEQQNTETDE